MRCVVIGAGITGLACADALVGRGAQVTIVDVAMPRDGASAVPTVVLIPPTGRLASKPLGKLASASYGLYPNWLAELSAYASAGTIGFAELGTLRVFREQSKPGRAPEHWLTAEELAAREPALGAGFAGGVTSAMGARLAAPALLVALEHRALAGGMARVTGVVSQFDLTDNRICGVRLQDGRRLPTDFVVIAAGLGTPTLLRALDVPCAIEADAGLIVQLAEIPAPQAIIQHGQFTLTPQVDGTVWVSGVHHAPSADPEHVREMTAMLYSAAHDVLGWQQRGRRGRILRVWEGVRPRLQGGVPIVGQVPGLSGVVVAAGHGSNGFLLAPLTARAVVDGVMVGWWSAEWPTAGPQPFGTSRRAA